jgi:hypothetical protein
MRSGTRFGKIIVASSLLALIILAVIVLHRRFQEKEARLREQNMVVAELTHDLEAASRMITSLECDAAPAALRSIAERLSLAKRRFPGEEDWDRLSAQLKALKESADCAVRDRQLLRKLSDVTDEGAAPDLWEPLRRLNSNNPDW